VDRLNGFNAVQNTYLATFQVLGGIGLLLGSIGLGVVVLRNVLDRRGELAVLLAVGFRPRLLHRVVLVEHVCLLFAGLLAGLAAATLSVVPQMKLSGTRVPFGWLGLLILAVLINGIVWTWLATQVAMRGKLLEALRNE